jgi:sulfatase modifying factor 1
MQLVTVGDAGNAADDTGLGAVDCVDRIGAFEVTIGQYAEFVNAVARDDTHDLYNTSMGTDLNKAGIARAGSPGSYSYAVMNDGSDSFNRPISHVTWFDAARFANWMRNGRPTGPQTAATTEDGAYPLDGATSGTAPAWHAEATFFISTGNEWYKAAYPKGGGLNAGSWEHATQSDSPSGNVVGGGTNQVKFCSDADLVFSVTQSARYLRTQNDLTNVGAFTNSGSAYGTFDQSGTVHAWNDRTGAADTTRGARGGSRGNVTLDLSASFSDRLSAAIDLGVGFRLASRA